MNLEGIDTSSFPMLDFVFKARRQGKTTITKEVSKQKKAKTVPVEEMEARLQKAGNRKMIKELGNVQVVPAIERDE